MRHLSVPKRSTQRFTEILQSCGWYPKGYKILSDGECTLIPISESATISGNKDIAGIPLVELERNPPDNNKNWITYLSNYLPVDVIEQHTGFWPNAQENFGELIIFKVDDRLIEYVQEIANAKIKFNKKAKLVLLDEGVEGKYRIRNLRPLTARYEGTLIDENQISHLSEEIRKSLLSTRESLTEYGAIIIADPSKAYYSPRLANEREKTVSSAKVLREKLGRPLNIADPYCGVGPAIIHLIRVPNLIDNILATDINPDAVELLHKNLENHNLPPPYLFPVGIGDALTLTDTKELVGKFDLLLMNLPHETIEHLPKLLPLLNRDNTTLLRGWAVLEESKIQDAERRLGEIISSRNPTTPIPVLEIRRQYSATKVLTRFEVWLEKSR